jgi:hypothetical protein
MEQPGAIREYYWLTVQAGKPMTVKEMGLSSSWRQPFPFHG